MKTFKLIPVLLCVFLLNVASMCSKDDDNSNPSADPTPIINTVNQGTWRVTLYNDSGTIKTSNFTGYNFTFGSGNVLTTINGSTTYNGSWSVTSGDSNDDNPSNDLDFNIGFTTPVNFSELTDDWDIVTYTASKIELRDVSGGNGGTDLLTFEKN
jgi:hypothetical protein